MNNILNIVNRYYLFNYKISKYLGGGASNSDAFTIIALDFGTICWCIIYFIYPIGVLFESIISAVVGFLLSYFLFVNGNRSENIIRSEPSITNGDMFLFFSIKVVIYFLLCTVAINSLNS